MFIILIPHPALPPIYKIFIILILYPQNTWSLSQLPLDSNLILHFSSFHFFPTPSPSLHFSSFLSSSLSPSTSTPFLIHPFLPSLPSTLFLIHPFSPFTFNPSLIYLLSPSTSTLFLIHLLSPAYQILHISKFTRFSLQTIFPALFNHFAPTKTISNRLV